jgi:hypothetical protein
LDKEKMMKGREKRHIYKLKDERKRINRNMRRKKKR